MTRDELVTRMAEAMARQEGFYAAGNTPAKRNHNPGNLRAWRGCKLPTANGFVVFPGDAAGWEQLHRQIRLNIARGLTLFEFFAGERDENGKVIDIVKKDGHPPRPGYYGYAPAQDANDPVAYAAAVAKALGGVKTDVPIEDLTKESVA